MSYGVFSWFPNTSRVSADSFRLRNLHDTTTPTTQQGPCNDDFAGCLVFFSSLGRGDIRVAGQAVRCFPEEPGHKQRAVLPRYADDLTPTERERESHGRETMKLGIALLPCTIF